MFNFNTVLLKKIMKVKDLKLVELENKYNSNFRKKPFWFIIRLDWKGLKFN